MGTRSTFVAGNDLKDKKKWWIKKRRKMIVYKSQ